MLKTTIIFCLVTKIIFCQNFTIARINYGGGGDWYSDPSSLPNLLDYLSKNTPMSVISKEARIEINSRVFRDGYIMLEGVDLKYNII